MTISLENILENIFVLVDQIKKEIPSRRFAESGDDPVQLDRIKRNLHELNKWLDILNSFYRTRPLYDKDVYSNSIRIAQMSQQFIKDMRWDGDSNQIKTERLIVCIQDLETSLRKVDFTGEYLATNNSFESIKPWLEESNSPEEVFFTAFHQKEAMVKTWSTLLVYAHISSALAKVQEDAKRFNDQIKSPKETTSKSSTPIARGTELNIVPSCEGITFNPERVSFKWMEDFHRADFRFKADQSLSGDAAKGSIDIYVGPLIIGTLKFAMLFNEKESQPVSDHEEHAKMYGKDDVFISYSRKDSEVARTFKNILEGTGLDVFLDVDDLRSGQLWEDELKRRIERAQIFQIFWSTNYSQSENCKLEWEYALQQNKEEGYIRPVYWEKPISPKPPEGLNKYNFKYVELKM